MRRVVAAVTALGFLLAAAGAQAATTVGETFAPDASSNCSGSATIAQVAQAGQALSYRMPNPGVITSWSHRAGAAPLELKLKVLRGESPPFLFVGESSFGQVPATTLGTFKTRIPVQAGDRLGLFIPGPSTIDCASPEIFAMTHGLYSVVGDHSSGSASYSFFSFRRLDLAAVLEPDADGDGFGDESQDGCPIDATIQGACPTVGAASGPSAGSAPIPPDIDPPETSFKKRPANAIRAQRARYVLLADEQGARFEYKLDGKAWRSCSSKLTIGNLSPGRHLVKVRAIDAAGNIDVAPAKDRFRVLG